MAPETDPPGTSRQADAKSPRQGIEDLVATYIDRLTDGEKLDRNLVLAEQPERGLEILEYLEAFVDFGAKEDDKLGALGDYTLRRRIGRGGMGVVYDAWENSMDRRVALKVLPPGIAADERALQRFVREAKTAGQLSHPNIVSVYGMGLKEQTPYYAMEFVEGETLAHVAAKLKEAAPEATTPFGHKDGAGYFEQIARAFADVAEGLQHAHARRVIHRDIKPSNLILDHEGRLRILGFGLARLEGQDSITMSGDIVGTVQYMSPEQAQVKRIAVDHRTDIYSLGATMYEVLTLRPPFKGRDHHDTLTQIITRDPTPPSKLNARVPRDLETIVLKCLRKPPEDRYGTAEALAQDLRRFTRGDAIEARPKSRWENWLTLVAQHRTRITLAAAVGGLLLAVGALGLSAWRDTQRAKWAEYIQMVDRAQVDLETGTVTAPGQILEGETAFLGLFFPEEASGEHLRELLLKTLSGLDDAARLFPMRPEAEVLRWRVLWALGQVDSAAKALDRALSLDPGYVPAALLRLEELRFDGRNADIEDRLRELDQTTKAGWQREYLDAYGLALRAEWKELDEAYRQLLRAFPAEPFVGFATDLRLKRARLALLRGDHLSAVENYVFLRDSSHALGPALLLAGAYYRMGQREAARRTVDTALSDHPGTMTPEDSASVCFTLGDREKARQIIDAMTDEAARAAMLQAFLWGEWKLDDALQAGRKAIALGSNGVDVYLNQYWLLLDLQRPLDARACGEEALAKFGESPARKYVLAELGWSYDYFGETDKAIELYEQAVPLSRALLGLGFCYFRKGELETSDRCLHKSLLRYPRSAPAHFGLARNCIFRDDPKGAIVNMIQCHLLCPDFESEVFLKSYMPQRKDMFAPHWDDLAEVMGRAIDTGNANPSILGLSALARLNKTTPDVAGALIHAKLAVTMTCGFNGRLLAVLAEAQAADGKIEDAIRTMEQAVEASDRPGYCVELLETYRRGFLPHVASAASVDALRVGNGGEFGGSAEWSPSSPEIARYVDACRLQAAGESQKASEILENLVSSGTGEPCVVVRLARLWADLGRREQALSLLEGRLLGTEQATVGAWSTWMELASREPALAVGVLAARDLTCQADDGAERGEHSRWLADDVRWLLGELSTNGELRISCGRESDYVDSRGRTWSHDRFFEGGQGPGRFVVAVRNSEEQELYQKRRWWRAEAEAFLAAGYRIPVPCGRYEVVLHFCRPIVFPPDAERRLFDVSAEGSLLLGDFDPAGGEVGVVDLKTFQIDVKDGCLDLVFRSKHAWAAYVSAIELRCRN